MPFAINKTLKVIILCWMRKALRRDKGVHLAKILFSDFFTCF
jgi:hypothetical protein